MSRFRRRNTVLVGQPKRAAAREEVLGDDFGEVSGTSLDKGMELDALAKLPKNELCDLFQALGDELIDALANLRRLLGDTAMQLRRDA
jgi:hypothetical protein